MKRTFCVVAAIAGLLFANTIMAQEKTEETTGKKKKHHTFTVSNKGIYLSSYDSATKAKAGKIVSEDKEKKGRFSTSFAMVDLGLNLLQDNTNYTDPSVNAYLAGVPAANRTTSLFDLRPAKSINVNIYPWMLKFAAVKTHGQRIYISTGLGLQLYNFRYEEPITYVKNPAGIMMDSIAFHKNKLGLDYLNIPLMLTFKTRLYKDNWLVYGVGITEGLRIDSWTKQKSDTRGKDKTHGSYGLADFNTCLSAEIGVEGVVRFYASYQVTSLYNNGLDQHPISFGLRFSGI